MAGQMRQISGNTLPPIDANGSHRGRFYDAIARHYSGDYRFSAVLSRKAGKAPWRQAGMAVIYRVWVQWVAVHAGR